MAATRVARFEAEPVAVSVTAVSGMPLSVMAPGPLSLLADPLDPRPGLGGGALRVTLDGQQVRPLPVVGEGVGKALEVAGLDEIHQGAVPGGVLAGGLDLGAGPPVHGHAHAH